MNSKVCLRDLLIYLSIMISINSVAQPALTIYTDVGSNNVSHGLSIKSVALAQLIYGKYRIETGIQYNIRDNSKKSFSGYEINASRDFLIHHFPFRAEGFCIWTRPSDILREANLGALLQMRHNRFEMLIGTNFNKYYYSKQAVRKYEIARSAEKIHEVFNMMYSFSCNLKRTDENWNAGLTLTNIDHFLISQETNPLINLHVSIQAGRRIRLFTEAWYKCAGITNMELNHFGYNINTGLIWKL
jgi:hypothetical protein